MKLQQVRLVWLCKNSVTVGHYSIPCSDDICQDAARLLVRRDHYLRRLVKSLLWPIYSLWKTICCDGFVRRTVGRWLVDSVNAETVLIEVGCGDMELRKSLPSITCYNAFDVSFSEFHLRRVLKEDRAINIAIASAASIPLHSSSVNTVISTEVFEHIPDIDKAMKEINRVAVVGAKLICSIPNNYCYKYKKKGPHLDHVNNWSYEEFISFMAEYGFSFVKGCKKGYWLPLPTWITKTSYQLPITSKDEYYCTNFFYLFVLERKL